MQAFGRSDTLRLVQVASSVDPGDIGAVFVAHRRQLVSLSWMLLGDSGTAEDVVQECFFRLSGPSQLDGIEDPSAYLRRMVINESRAVMNRRSREVATDTPPERAELQPHNVEMLDALKGLTTRRRTAVVLRYFEGWAVQDIAELMGCRPSTVSSLLNRSMSDLRKVLP